MNGQVFLVGRGQAEPAPPVVAKGSIPFIYQRETFRSLGDPNLFTPKGVPTIFLMLTYR